MYYIYAFRGIKQAAGLKQESRTITFNYLGTELLITTVNVIYQYHLSVDPGFIFAFIVIAYEISYMWTKRDITEKRQF